MTNDNDSTFQDLAGAVQEIDRLRAELERAKAENAKLRSMSTVEMMCENLNVKHHVEEWEARCLKAEADNARLGKTVKLLEVAECPECDGTGAKSDHCGGQVECQWCRERNAELARLRAVMGEKE